jgi:DNA-binding NtrC family response regulator
MIVEDELDILHLVEKYLKVWKFRTEGYADPREALDAFLSNPSKYSLVLTDIRMQGMSGIDLAREILRIKPDMKVAIMTAFDVTDEMLDGITTIRHSEIVKKPFRLAEICESVKRQLQIAK